MGIAADIALILVAGLAGGLVAHRLRQPVLLGYIAAGVLVGPYTVGPTVVEVHEIELLAEIGVALMLFALGLEVSFRDMRPVRGVAVIGGVVQILLTIAFGYGLGRTLLELDDAGAVWFGSSLSLSSTMVVLQTIAARGVLHTLASRVMIGILIVQDLAVAPMLILLPELGRFEESLPVLGIALAKAVAFLAGMIFVGIKLMPALLRLIARWRSRELFLVAVLTIAVGVGYGTYLFGLSFAFGAFVAGMVLSESEFSHQALGDVIPLRDLFALLFFASVGMLFDPGFLFEHATTVLACVAVVLLGKALIFGVLTRAFGYVNMAPLIVALGLSQVGEFSFVLAREGLRQDFLTHHAYSLALSTAVLTMVLTPLLMSAAGPVYRWYRYWVPRGLAAPTMSLPQGLLRDHVIVVGYGRTGQAAVEVMASTDVPFVVVESDHARFADCVAASLPAVWGDGAHGPVLQAARIETARLLLVTVPDAQGIRLVVQRARELNPEVELIARALYREHLDELRRLGIHEVVQPEFEAGLEMVRQVLTRYGFAPADVLRFSDAIHDEVYRSLSAQPTREGLQALEQLRRALRGIEIEWIHLPASSPLVGRSIAESQFRGRTGASIVAVRQDGGVQPNPVPDYVFEAGALLGVLGTTDQRHHARELIGGAESLGGRGTVEHALE